MRQPRKKAVSLVNDVLDVMCDIQMIILSGKMRREKKRTLDAPHTYIFTYMLTRRGRVAPAPLLVFIRGLRFVFSIFHDFCYVRASFKNILRIRNH